MKQIRGLSRVFGKGKEVFSDPPKEMIIPPDSHEECAFCSFLRNSAPRGATVMIKGKDENEILVLYVERVDLKEFEQLMVEAVKK